MSAVEGDDDGDGLPNAWEGQHGPDPFDPGALNVNNGPLGDPDHDGASNWLEYQAGTAPQDAASLFAIRTAEALSGGAIRLYWSSVAGKRCNVERAVRLEGPFIVITHGLGATPPANSFVDQPAAGPGPWFYRIGLD